MTTKSRFQNLIRNLYNTFVPFFKKSSWNRYNPSTPHPQDLLNLFENEWISSFPSPLQDLKAGKYPLFEDTRVLWGIEQLGGMEKKNVIELGPLEGAHSYLLQKHGAASIEAIEANPRSYLKCLLVKQIFQLNKVNFLFGDFNAYLRLEPRTYDVCFASGVLYHMKNPIELLSLISQKSRELFLWTHYYDAKACREQNLQSKFAPSFTQEVEGFRHTLHPFHYGASRFWSTFIGGPARSSCWLSRQDILNALHFFGYTDIKIHFEEIDGVNGPCFSLVAKKNAIFF